MKVIIYVGEETHDAPALEIHCNSNITISTDDNGAWVSFTTEDTKTPILVNLINTTNTTN